MQLEGALLTDTVRLPWVGRSGSLKHSRLLPFALAVAKLEDVASEADLIRGTKSAPDGIVSACTAQHPLRYSYNALAQGSAMELGCQAAGMPHLCGGGRLPVINPCHIDIPERSCLAAEVPRPHALLGVPSRWRGRRGGWRWGSYAKQRNPLQS